MVGPERKGAALGLTVFLGSFAGVCASPAFGWASDRWWASRFGRRLPLMCLGLLISFAPAWGMAQATSLPLFAGAFALVQCFLTGAISPYNALVNDLVPPSQRGTASGILGGCIALGNLAGAGVGLFYAELGAPGTIGIAYTLLAAGTACTALAALTAGAAGGSAIDASGSELLSRSPSGFAAVATGDHVRYASIFDGAGGTLQTDSPARSSALDSAGACARMRAAARDFLRPFADSDFFWVRAPRPARRNTPRALR
jgi:hypothetical protein